MHTIPLNTTSHQSGIDLFRRDDIISYNAMYKYKYLLSLRFGRIDCSASNSQKVNDTVGEY